MTGHDEEQALAGWRLVGGWLREQKLWRDVLTRVIAGVITAACIYLGALLLGYLHTPEISAGLLLALGIASGVVLTSTAIALLASVGRRHEAGRPVLGRIITAIVLVIAAIAIVVGVVADVAG